MYDGLETFQSFMERNSWALLLGIVVAAASTPALILIHELGHALAVKLRGLPLRQLKVGKQTDLIVGIGGFRMELGRLWGKGDVGGYVRYDGRGATPHDVLVIALAGPGANLAGALVTGWLALRFLGAAAWLPATLGCLTYAGVLMAVSNLASFRYAADPTMWSDGHWARVAWRDRRRRGPLWRDPNEATSVAPPAAAGG